MEKALLNNVASSPSQTLHNVKVTMVMTRTRAHKLFQHRLSIDYALEHWT